MPSSILAKSLRAPRLALHRMLHRREPSFECPLCGYTGPFANFARPTGLRRHAQCPSCGALERHRLQYVVLQEALADRDRATTRVLHVAPEPFFRRFFAERFPHYETADLSMRGVDHHVDLVALPFPDASYDVIFASHVLEHIRDDARALAELRRVLRPGGIAILPVPIVAERTVEYPEPNPHESHHVRAPGLDYFERYERHFARVERRGSEQFPARFQLFIYEDRTHWPTQRSPLRPAMAGERHVDVVPVCYA